MTGRQRRRGEQLLDDLAETTYSWKMEALDRTLWRTAFGSLVALSQDTLRKEWLILRAQYKPRSSSLYSSLHPLVTTPLIDPHIFFTVLLWNTLSLFFLEWDQTNFHTHYKSTFSIPSEVHSPCFGTATTCSRHVARGTAMRYGPQFKWQADCNRHCLLPSRRFPGFKAAEAWSWQPTCV